MSALTADDIIAELNLERHPEGGWYAQTFRDAPDGGRGYSTAIYFLLKAGEVSHWHRVIDAAEVWHWYCGAPMSLSVSADGKTSRTLALGPDLGAGQRPQLVVPAGHWQSAVSDGEWTLAGCTVAPGFEFEGFELAAPGWAPSAHTR